MQTVASPAGTRLSTSLSRAQRRTLSTLVATQTLGSLGMIVGMSVGALLVARIAGGPGMSGLAQSAVAVGGALLALPVTRLMQSYGRRPGLAVAYLTGVVGAALVIAAAVFDSTPMVLMGMFLFGGGTTASMQARYTAADLARPDRRGRQISIVIWAGTVGAAAGPMLAAPADQLTSGLELPPLTGPFVFSMLGFGAAAVLLLAFLRPDPLLTARRLPDDFWSAAPRKEPVSGSYLEIGSGVESRSKPAALEAGAAAFEAGAGTFEAGAEARAAASAAPGRRPMAQAAREVWRRPDALLGLLAIAGGHAVMLGVMVMTPIHIDAMLSGGHAGHGGADDPRAQADVLRLVGLVLSLHVAGMFAFSPAVGHAADRLGRRPVLVAGALVLLVACALAGTADDRGVQLSAGLFLLGLGWSCTLIAGSALLTDSTPTAVRPSAQGLSDLVMGLAGAAAGALSGVVVELAGYSTLTVMAAAIATALLAVSWPRDRRTDAVTV